MAVLGSGPGGYTAAFRAADLGMEVTLVERYPTLGGVCLNVGCIPSKALLHLARVMEEAEHLGEAGIAYAPPQVDPAASRAWVESVVGRLTGGLAGMAKQRKVTVVEGAGRFAGRNELTIQTPAGAEMLEFEQCIIAAGSQSRPLPNLPDDPRIMDSTGALLLDEIPKRLLVIGGGIIGLEMATVYAALGSEITVVEALDRLMPGPDADLLKPLERRIRKRYAAIHTGVMVTSAQARADGIEVDFEGDKAPAPGVFDRVLVAVGRVPNGGWIAAEHAGVTVDERGFIPADNQLRTNQPHIFAIGDIVGHPMLAHKATHEGKVAAEAAAGLKVAFDARVVPSVAYTDPEVAWVGLTEAEAKERGVDYGKGVFPWAASGRAISMQRSEGMTKLLFDASDGRVIGGGIVGMNAGDLISEVAHAIEMGAEAEDLALTIHPHPTLSESVGMAAEAYLGVITDLYQPPRATNKQ
ncbi:dihydrolipoyl dehydrogenase [Candidatus Foliamicus sp.]